MQLQDQTVVGIDADGRLRRFHHPLFQSFVMFSGETLCLVVHMLLHCRSRCRRHVAVLSQPTLASRARRLAAFAVPAGCDVLGSTLLNVALILTTASVYATLRGTVLLFAGLLTAPLLGRRLEKHHWVGMLLVVLGSVLCGISSALSPDVEPRPPPVPVAPAAAPAAAMAAAARRLLLAAPSRSSRAALVGDALVVAAQLAAASQFVVEERFLASYDVPPLLAVGLEGAWGILFCLALAPLAALLPASSGRQPFDSLPAALAELRAHPHLKVCVVSSLFSVALFNFFGVTLTKRLSGGSRAAIDALRTVMIWVFALAARWETFHWLQLLGFAVLVCGTGAYNGLLPGLRPQPLSAAAAAAAAGGGHDDGDLTAPLLAATGLEAGLRPPAAGPDAVGAVTASAAAGSATDAAAASYHSGVSFKLGPAAPFRQAGRPSTLPSLLSASATAPSAAPGRQSRTLV